MSSANDERAVQTGDERWAAVVSSILERSRQELPAWVRRRVGAVIADTVGVAQLSADVAELDVLALLGGSGPSSTVLGRAPGAPPGVAARVNAAAAVWRELDEGYRGAGHPAAHVVPAAAAVAEAEGAPIGLLLTAVLCGYELQVALGRGFEVRDDVHPHGALGAPAAAFAASVVLGLGSAECLRAVQLAANLAPAGSWSACHEGSTVRNLFAGYGAQLGVDAAYLARGGVTAPTGSIELALGSIRGRRRTEFGWNPAAPWSLTEGYVKRWSACAWSHTALDIVQHFRGQIEPGRAARISEIVVEVPASGMRLAAVNASSPLAARFSIPVLVATLIAHGALEPWLDRAGADSAIMALAGRIIVRESAAMTRSWPHHQVARVRIEFDDGAVLCAERDDPLTPTSTDGYVQEVARKLAGRGLSTALLERLTARDPDPCFIGTVGGIFAPATVPRAND